MWCGVVKLPKSIGAEALGPSACICKKINSELVELLWVAVMLLSLMVLGASAVFHC